MSSDNITITITIEPGGSFGQSYFYDAAITFEGYGFKSSRRRGEVHLMWSPKGEWDSWGRREWVEDNLMLDVEDFEWAAEVVLKQLKDRTPRNVILTWSRPVWDHEAELRSPAPQQPNL